MNRLKIIYQLTGCIIVGVLIGSANAGAITSLEQFYRSVNTLKANFRQTVYDADQKIIDQSNGVLYIARPGKFRWEYASPLPQYIVSDANKIWIHDLELEQVTVRNYQQTLAGTPAELLAGTGDIKKQYNVRTIDKLEDDLEWVQLVPKVDDTQFIDIEIGFNKKGKLTVMLLTDSFERSTQLIFDDLEENAPINLSLFSFDVPDGIDVIDNTENF